MSQDGTLELKHTKVADGDTLGLKHDVTVVERVLCRSSNSRHSGRMPPNERRHRQSVLLIFLA